MKTITFFKRVLASAALVSVCGFACATNNGKQFIHNDTMEGGKLVCREIYAMNDAASGILNPVKMYKYSYDTDQQKTVKSTYAWNIFKNTWETESRTVISRYETETSVEYSVWNKEKGSFDLSKKYIYITDNNNQLIAQYAYKMNSRTNQWILEKDALTPIYENIYATTEPLGCRESQTPQSDEPERKRKKPNPEVGKRTIILCSLYRNIVSPPNDQSRHAIGNQPTEQS